MQASGLLGRNQLLGTLHVHDVDFVFVDVLLHGRHQFRAFGVRHRNQVFDAHGVGHLATKTLSRDTGRNALSCGIDSRSRACRATTDHQNVKRIFLVDLTSFFFSRVGVQPGRNLFQRHPALAPGLAIQVNTGYRHHFTLLNFVLEQGTVNGGVLDVRVQHAHQVQGLNHVRAVLAGQREVGFKLELTFQLLNLLDHFLRRLGWMATHLQQGQHQRSEFVAHGNTGKANANVGAYTIDGEGRTTHLSRFLGPQADLLGHRLDFFQQLLELLGLLAVVIGCHQLNRLLQLFHIGLQLSFDIGIQHVWYSPLCRETKFLNSIMNRYLKL